MHYKQYREEGFALIELLVVILIMGILSSVAVPVFLNQRQISKDAVAQSDLKNAVMSAETFFTNNPTATRVDLNEIKKLMTKDPGSRMSFTGTHKDYCVEIVHKYSKEYKTIWTYSSLEGKAINKDQRFFSCSGYGTKTSETHALWVETA